jgi:hypothetical protein
VSNEEFVQSFENCSLPNESFHHREHVKLAWLYLTHYPVLAALDRFISGLKSYAGYNGKPERYHETITWAYLLLTHERMVRSGNQQSWEEFAAANQDLLSWQDSVLKKYYREDTLLSDIARRAFLFPDKNL